VIKVRREQSVGIKMVKNKHKLPSLDISLPSDSEDDSDEASEGEANKQLLNILAKIKESPSGSPGSARKRQRNEGTMDIKATSMNSFIKRCNDKTVLLKKKSEEFFSPPSAAIVLLEQEVETQRANTLRCREELTNSLNDYKLRVSALEASFTALEKEIPVKWGANERTRLTKEAAGIHDQLKERLNALERRLSKVTTEKNFNNKMMQILYAALA
jgi:hypothetical protein